MESENEKQAIKADEQRERTLFVSNLDERVTDELLYELMVQAGPLEKVTIIKKENHIYAFIIFEDEESVPYSIKLFRNVKLFGRQLILKPRENTEQQRKLEASRRSEIMASKPPEPQSPMVQPISTLSQFYPISPIPTSAFGAPPNFFIEQHGRQPWPLPLVNRFAFDSPPTTTPRRPTPLTPSTNHRLGLLSSPGFGPYHRGPLLSSHRDSPYPHTAPPRIFAHSYNVGEYDGYQRHAAGHYRSSGCFFDDGSGDPSRHWKGDHRTVTAANRYSTVANGQGWNGGPAAYSVLGYGDYGHGHSSNTGQSSRSGHHSVSHHGDYDDRPPGTDETSNWKRMTPK